MSSNKLLGPAEVVAESQRHLAQGVYSENRYPLWTGQQFVYFFIFLEKSGSLDSEGAAP